jgi:hypothetical protein
VASVYKYLIMSKTIVIQPGGYHPLHAGHMALYRSIQKQFPGAEIYLAASNDTESRPFPFAVKEKLARLAGIEPGRFVQVASPFRANEITDRYDPTQDRLIFVRSTKDADQSPLPGGNKKDGSPKYLQPYQAGQEMAPFGQHAYMAYLPTVEFGPGLTSASQIRAAWPQLTPRRKTALVMSMYPRTQGNAQLANTVVQLLDAVLSATVTESIDSTVEAWGYLYNHRDQRVAWRKTFPSLAAAERWAQSKNATLLGSAPVHAGAVSEESDSRAKSQYAPELERDPELRAAKMYARQHYSKYADEPQMAFDKWVQRSLQHGLEDDQQQFKLIQTLTDKVRRLEKQLQRLTASVESLPVAESDHDFVAESSALKK